jgi:SAM-dependent methyltransferase
VAGEVDEVIKLVNLKNMEKITDKAGEKYWTNAWEHMQLAPSINPHSKNINNYPFTLLHKVLTKYFSSNDCNGKLLLEIGCGNSVFLPYLHKYFGFKISGIDYSQYACEQTKKILARDKVEGEIIFGDAFNPPLELIGKFDVVCSFGVIEHFDKTAETLKEFSKFMKPGGLMVTIVPNLAGLTGYLQRHFFKPVYDIHVPMDKKYLDNAIAQSGLELLSSEYCHAVNVDVVLFDAGSKAKYYWLKKIIIRLLRYVTKVIWIFEMMIAPLPARKTFSNFIISIARKK